tara:strand:- start:554 stop:1273 length:720 start_codon:yes stop_codon:yes gene_type:complete
MTVADFSIQIKEGTKKSHSAAENTSFVASFLRGVVSKESYKNLVKDLYYVYRTLEEEFEKHKDHPVVGKLYLPELNRVNNLERDLRFYYGPEWRSIIMPSVACANYVSRIKCCSIEDPTLLVGHHYTRYLGDLSGGQILYNIAKRSLPFTNYELDAGEGLHFYEFDKIENAKEYKEGYRAILNGLDIDQHKVDAIIVEANYAFRLNMYMFDTLEGNWLQSLIQMIVSFITSILKKTKSG